MPGRRLASTPGSVVLCRGCGTSFQAWDLLFGLISAAWSLGKMGSNPSGFPQGEDLEGEPGSS